MRLGVGSYTYPWHVHHGRMSIRDLIDAAAEAAVSIVQICDNLPFVDLDSAERASIRKYADQRGVEIQAGMRGLFADAVRANLKACEDFGSPFLRIVIDSRGFEPDLPEIVERVRALLPDIRSSGRPLLIENHDRLPAEDLKHIIEATDPAWIGICLDCVNSYGSGEDTKTVLSALAPYTRNLHLKDFAIRRIASQLGFVVEGAPTGEGLLDLDLLQESLPATISAIIELWTPEQGSVEETLEMERDWARRSLANARLHFADRSREEACHH